jgi:gliding motility-associated-like protein
MLYRLISVIQKPTIMKTSLRSLLLAVFFLTSVQVLHATHGLPIVNLTYTIGPTGVTIAGNSDPATCGPPGPYWMQAKVSCNPTSFSNTLPDACAETHLQNWAGPGVTYNAFPWYSSLLNVPNYTAAGGWFDQCALEPYHPIFIPYTDLCPGKVYYFAVRELVTSSNSVGLFSPVVSFTVPGTPVVDIPGSITSSPSTSPSSPSCGGSVLLTLVPPSGCGPKKTIPPGCTVCDTIVWRGPGGTVIAVNTLTVLVNPTSTSTYTVSWDTCNPVRKVGCGAPFIPTITVYVANTNAMFTAPSTICSGTTLNLISMFPAPVDLWTVSPTTSVTPNSSAMPVFNPTFDLPGNYVITHQSINGPCMDTYSTNITVTPGILTSITTSGGGCGSLSNTGSATVAVSSGTAGITYTWSPVGGNGPSVAGLLFNTTYSVTLSNGGCTITKTLQVTNNLAPTISSFSVTPPTCSGQANGQIAVNLSGGNLPFSFTWTPGITQHTQTVTGIGAGTYSVFVLDNNGCTTSGTVSVTQPSPLSLSAPTNATICAGSSASLSVSASGGGSPYTYIWNPGNLSGSTVTVNPTSGTQYTCTVTDANGCTQSRTANVEVRPLLSASVSVQHLCAGDSVVLSPVITSPGTGGPYSYSWSTGSTASTITVHAAGTPGIALYNLTLSDGCNPNAAVTFTVITDSTPIADITADSLIGNAPLTVHFTDNGTGGGIFNWHLGNGSSSNTQQASTHYINGGNYVVTFTVTNADGCSDYDTLSITVIDLAPQIIIPNVFTPNGDGANELFDIKGINLSRYDCSVFNRWGKLVFNSTDVKHKWDGKINGNPAEEGTYFYVVKAGSAVGEEIKEQGYVSLFR